MQYLGILLQIAVVAYLILVEPFYGRRLYGELVRTVATDPGVRRRYYGRILWLEWGLVAVTLLSLWLRKQPLATLGLQAWSLGSERVQAAVVGVLGGAVVGIFLSVAMALVSAKVRAAMGKQLASLQAMLPVTVGERWQFAGVSVTAGICEELLFRGLLLFLLQELIPGIPAWAAVLVPGLFFGVAHLYQGWRGVLLTGLLGAAFTGLYLAVHSLYPGMLIHALIDLRVLALMLVIDRRRSAGAAL